MRTAPWCLAGNEGMSHGDGYIVGIHSLIAQSVAGAHDSGVCQLKLQLICLVLSRE